MVGSSATMYMMEQFLGIKESFACDVSFPFYPLLFDTVTHRKVAGVRFR